MKMFGGGIVKHKVQSLFSYQEEREMSRNQIFFTLEMFNLCIFM